MAKKPRHAGAGPKVGRAEFYAGFFMLSGALFDVWVGVAWHSPWTAVLGVAGFLVFLSWLKFAVQR